MLLAVVVCGVVLTDNGHGHVNRGDGLVAVGDVEGDVGEVRVVVCELTCIQSHIGRANVGSRSFSRAAESEVFFGIEVGFFLANHDAGDFVAAHAVFLAVVVGGVVITDNRYGHINRGDGQCTTGGSIQIVGVGGLRVNGHCAGIGDAGYSVAPCIHFGCAVLNGCSRIHLGCDSRSMCSTVVRPCAASNG